MNFWFRVYLHPLDIWAALLQGINAFTYLEGGEYGNYDNVCFPIIGSTLSLHLRRTVPSATGGQAICTWCGSPENLMGPDPVWSQRHHRRGFQKLINFKKNFFAFLTSLLIMRMNGYIWLLVWTSFFSLTVVKLCCLRWLSGGCEVSSTKVWGNEAYP